MTYYKSKKRQVYKELPIYGYYIVECGAILSIAELRRVGLNPEDKGFKQQFERVTKSLRR